MPSNNGHSVSTPIVSARLPLRERPLVLPKFKTVLACTDFSPLAETAIESAVELGRKLGTERIHLAHVVPIHADRIVEAMASRAAQEIAIEDRNVAIKAITSIDLPMCEAAITREVRVGEPVRSLALLAGEIGADLVVVGSRGRGMLGRWFLGSVAQELARLAPCPVLIIYEENRRVTRFEEIVAAVDLSEMSEAVLANALAIAKPFQGAVRAISVFEGDGPFTLSGSKFGRRGAFDRAESDRMAALASSVQRLPTDGTEVTLHVVADEHAYHGVLELAYRGGADLIVIGSNGRGSLERALLGSTSTKLVEKSTIPVLVVPKGCV
jgi:nucleotide-binding universal stress UspA family protein